MTEFMFALLWHGHASWANTPPTRLASASPALKLKNSPPKLPRMPKTSLKRNQPLTAPSSRI
eukprot:8355392-Ditylum_brightwellii.AAC.1